MTSPCLQAGRRSRAVLSRQLQPADRLLQGLSTAAAAPGSSQYTDSLSGVPEIDQTAETFSQKLVGRMLRANMTAEAASARLYAGQSCVRPQAGDIKLFQERGEALVDRVENIAPQYRTRPSLLAPAVRATAFGLGAVSSYLPNPLRASIAGAMQEAIVEQYNDQLRELREAGLADELTDVRATLRDLRDEERAPEGIKAPDLMKLQRPQELSLEEGVAGVVKYGFKALFSAAERV